MKNKIFGILQRVGRSFMLPIAILPVAGLLLGLGSSFTNATTLETYRLTGIMGPGTVLYVAFKVMQSSGNIVFTNLPIIFAMGVAIGMAKKEKEVAALSAAIAFFIMHAAVNAMIELHGGTAQMLNGATASICGITSLQMGVFGGIIVGLGVAALHNRFYKIELPQALSFFAGTRFVPVISAIAYTMVGIVMFFVWPMIQNGIYTVGNLVLKSGYAGTWIYGFMERILIPFGLHHVFYLPFWQTGLGGSMVVAGKTITGAQNIFFAQLTDPATTKFAVSATRFMSGKFPLMIFGLPGAAFAMYKTAKPENRKIAGGLLLSAALTSMITGITEPIEFTFLFVAPVLYGIHCIFAGISYMLMHIFNVGVGMTFSGGMIDLILFGVLQGNAKTNWIWVIIVGIGYFIIYYLIFFSLINKLDLKTPGRDDREEIKLYKRSDFEAKKNKSELSKKICKGLGGRKNISDVDCCATRLRCTVFDADLVYDEILEETGPSGIFHNGNGIQIIYGPQVAIIKANLLEYIETASEESTDIAKRVVISSPVTGLAASIETAPDKAFSEKMMGDGAVVIPVEPAVCAPADGMIEFVFHTKHAIGFRTENNISLVMHIGINTVELNGKGFETFVTEGQKVKKGDLLMKLDLDYLRKNAVSLVSPVICTELDDDQRIHLITEGKIKAGDPLFEIEYLNE